MLIEENGALYPIGFKKTAMPDRNAVKHFSTLRKLGLPIAEGAVVGMLKKYLPITEGIQAVPVAYL